MRRASASGPTTRPRTCAPSHDFTIASCCHGMCEYAPKVPGEFADERDSGDERTGPGLLDASGRPIDPRSTDWAMPRWVIPAIALFWAGYVFTFTFRHVFHRLSSLLVLLLVSLFLALAIEPGVNRLGATRLATGPGHHLDPPGCADRLLDLRRRRRHVGGHAGRRPAVAIGRLHHRHCRLPQRQLRYRDRRAGRHRRSQRPERAGAAVHLVAERQGRPGVADRRRR